MNCLILLGLTQKVMKSERFFKAGDKEAVVLTNNLNEVII